MTQQKITVDGDTLQALADEVASQYKNLQDQRNKLASVNPQMGNVASFPHAQWARQEILSRRDEVANAVDKFTAVLQQFETKIRQTAASFADTETANHAQANSIGPSAGAQTTGAAQPAAGASAPPSGGVPVQPNQPGQA
jgi:uncharacterized protein YukE